MSSMPYPVSKPIVSLEDALHAKRSAGRWSPGEIADDRLIEMVAFRLADLWATYPPQPGEPAQLPYLVQSSRSQLFDEQFRRQRLKRRLQHPLNPLPSPRYDLATCSNILGSLRLGNRFRQAMRARFENPTADALSGKIPKSGPLPYAFIRRATWMAPSMSPLPLDLLKQLMCPAHAIRRQAGLLDQVTNAAVSTQAPRRL